MICLMPAVTMRNRSAEDNRELERPPFGARQSFFPGPLSWDCAWRRLCSARRGEHGDVSWRYMGPGGSIWWTPAGRFRGVWVARKL